MSSYSLVDLPALLRNYRPPAIRLDGEIREIPQQHKRWSKALQMIRTEQPEEIEILDQEGNCIARIDNAPEDPVASAPQSATEWIALTVAVREAYADLLDQQRTIADHLVRVSRELLKTQQEALAKAHHRAKALEELILADRERFDLARPPDIESDDDAEDTGLVTSLGDVAELLKLAPTLAPMLGALK